jgi:DNA polymerase alpha subunit A
LYFSTDKEEGSNVDSDGEGGYNNGDNGAAIRSWRHHQRRHPGHLAGRLAAAMRAREKEEEGRRRTKGGGGAVATRMVNNHKTVGVADHIPYVITALTDEDGQQQQQQQQQALAKKESVSKRVRHPDEVEWYLVNQILPPISRLCEPIDDTSPGIIAEKLGLDSSKYNGVSSANVGEDGIVNFTPALCLPDKEQFKGVEKLSLTCRSCGQEAEFPGIFCLAKDANAGTFHCVCCTNLLCRDPDCWGEINRWSCIAGIINKMTAMTKKHQRLYYEDWVRCNNPMCHLKDRQLSVFEGCCLKQGCNGRMKSVYTELTLQTQFKYFNSLFNVGHAIKQQRQRRYGRSTTQESILIKK